MSLIWMDGFDAYGTDGQWVEDVMKSSLYVQGRASASAATRTGRGYCLQFPQIGGNAPIAEIRKAFETKDGLVVGFAWKTEAINALRNICEFRYDNHFGGVYTHFVAYMTGDGAVTLACNGEKVFDTGPNILFPNVWHFIEIKITFHDSAGTVQVRVDGQTCAEYTGRTKLPNQPALCNLFRTGNGYLEDIVNNLVYLDDLYILDLEGDDFNGFLGDVVIHSVMPASDGGVNELSQYGGGLQHYTSVDDIPPDADLSYLYGNEVGTQEFFNVDPLPTNVINVLAVSVHARVKKDAAGASQIKLACKYDGIEEIGAAEPVTTQYVTRAKFYETPPGGGSWSKAKAEAMQIGFEVA
jgi:hypothetical protein